jgi:hypothetical protein
MTSNKQQTAVEWYIIKRDEIEMKIRLMQICANQYEQELIKADEQAKALHKQEIINSFFEGAYGGDNISGEQYYNETYGGGEQ